ncbi:hypothetical protein [Sciscionella marina]|uniref:hypothetical protein n=1 Tax=Sciscionella marina TaxID=508770 RepID=UPI000368DA81|nr:hypothetical protein [Sciscionella marina]
MRFADDKPLADAIESHVRYDRLRVRIGWKDDDFDGPYSDVSEYVTSFTTSRSLDTSLPDSAQIVQGASIGTGKLKLGGQREGDRLTVAQTLNPYRGDSPLYGYRVLDVPVIVDSIVPTGDGDRECREFTGLIRTIDIDPADNTVEIELWDVPQWLQAVVTLPRAALMARDRDAYNWHACMVSGSWVIGETMRQCGFTIGPPVWTEGTRRTYAYWSLAGGYLYNVGRMPANGGMQFYFRGDGQDTGNAWDDIEDKWTDGKYGLAANKPRTPLLLEADTDGVPYMPSINGSDFTHGISFWIRCGDDDIGEETGVGTGWGLKDSDRTDLVNENYAVTLFVTGSPNAAEDMHVVFTDEVTGKNVRVPFELPRDGEWHYVAGMVEFTGNTTVHAYVDDSFTGNASMGSVPQYANRVDYIEPGHARVILAAPMQHVSVWGQEGKAEDCVLPKEPDGDTPFPDLSESLLMCTHLPETVNTPGWDVIKGVCNAEYGIIYTTTEGVLRFRNRADLNELYGKTHNTRPKSVRTITGDVFDNIPITTDVDSVRNDITYQVRAKLSDWRVAFKSDDPFRYYTPTGDTKQWTDEPLGDDAVYMTRAGHGSVFLSHGETQLPETWGAFCNVDVDSFTERQTNVNMIVGQDANQRTMRFYVVNEAPSANVFAFPKQEHDGEGASKPDDTPPQPALSLMGLTWFDASARAYDGRKQDRGSIDKYRARTLKMEGGDWLQSRASADYIAGYLLDALKEPTPVTDSIEIPHDPRLELGDAITLEDSQSGSTLEVAISGIDAEWSTDKGYVDKLTVKFLQQQYEWILGDSSRSIFGQSTRL